MLIMRSVSKMMERTSPTGLILGGAVLALSIPTVRGLLRSAAVSIVAGTLTLSKRVQNIITSGREGLEDIVLEAKLSQAGNHIDVPGIEGQTTEHTNM
jgi:hypothetical protein